MAQVALAIGGLSNEGTPGAGWQNHWELLRKGDFADHGGPPVLRPAAVQQRHGAGRKWTAAGPRARSRELRNLQARNADQNQAIPTIRFGNRLADDQLGVAKYDYILSNPPLGAGIAGCVRRKLFTLDQRLQLGAAVMGYRGLLQKSPDFSCCCPGVVQTVSRRLLDGLEEEMRELQPKRSRWLTNSLSGSLSWTSSCSAFAY